MHHKGFCRFLKSLYGLALPAEGLSVDGEEGETDFADLEEGRSVRLGERGGDGKFLGREKAYKT